MGRRIINYIRTGRGKTEGLLRYRGKNAVKALGARRTPTGDITISIKCHGVADGTALSIVDCFKNLGGHITPDGGIGFEPCHRTSTAMQACTPLSRRVFGSSLIDYNIKSCFAWSLVFSRLFFNSHTWIASMTAVRKIYSSCHRVHRRIHGHSLYQSQGEYLRPRAQSHFQDPVSGLHRASNASQLRRATRVIEP